MFICLKIQTKILGPAGQVSLIVLGTNEWGVAIRRRTILRARRAMRNLAFAKACERQSTQRSNLANSSVGGRYTEVGNLTGGQSIYYVG
jgi:hypothetical protein